MLKKSLLQKIIITDNLTTRVDKEEDAKILEQKLLTEGYSLRDTKYIVAHEKRHTKADKRPGEFGIYKNREGEIIGAFYRPLGERSDDEMVAIVSASKELWTKTREGDIAMYLRILKNLIEKNEY